MFLLKQTRLNKNWLSINDINSSYDLSLFSSSYNISINTSIFLPNFFIFEDVFSKNLFAEKLLNDFRIHKSVFFEIF